MSQAISSALENIAVKKTNKIPLFMLPLWWEKRDNKRSEYTKCQLWKALWRKMRLEKWVESGQWG